jgi:D-lyxose ketol-isomerase
MLDKLGLAVLPGELERMEVADFGLGELEQSGGQIVTLVDSEQVAVKLLIMFPGQTLPEHAHVPKGSYAGKEETIRCEWGKLHLFLPGEPETNPRAYPPASRKQWYLARREIALGPGEQVTVPPGTPHWFQGGAEGAVVWSFSTKATDNDDVFTDPDVRRQTIIS